MSTTVIVPQNERPRIIRIVERGPQGPRGVQGTYGNANDVLWIDGSGNITGSSDFQYESQTLTVPKISTNVVLSGTPSATSGSFTILNEDNTLTPSAFYYKNGIEGKKDSEFIVSGSIKGGNGFISNHFDDANKSGAQGSDGVDYGFQYKTIGWFCPSGSALDSTCHIGLTVYDKSQTSIIEGARFSGSGDLYVYNNVIALATVLSSDERWKYDIRDYTSSLKQIEGLQPRQFKWKDSKKPAIGLIAQETREVMPEVVREVDTLKGHGLAINYTELIPTLINAVKELSDRVKYLENKLEK